MKNFGLIYKVTNTINNKSYIGQTTLGLRTRKRQHLNDARNGSKFHFHRSIVKYGVENFSFKILVNCSNLNELNTFECYYIKKFSTFKRSYGYNLNLGGNGNPGCESNNKVVLQYDLNGNFIKAWKSIRYVAEKLSLDRPSISNCCNGKRFKQVGGFVWRLKSDGFKKNLEINLEKNTRFKAKSVLQYSLKGDFINEFSSITSASKATSLSATLILNNCNGVTRLPKQFIWRYKNDPLDKLQVPKYIKRMPSKDNINKLIKAVSRSTLQYDLEGNLLKEFPSATEASKAVKVTPESIYKACSGKFKTVKGYKWRYK